MKDFTFSENTLLAILIISSILALLGIVVWRGLGGTEALFLIIGHLLAWGEIIVIHYFRTKKPTK